MERNHRRGEADPRSGGRPVNRFHTLTHCQTSQSLINDSRTIGIKPIRGCLLCKAVNTRPASSRGDPFHVDCSETHKLITLNS